MADILSWLTYTAKGWPLIVSACIIGLAMAIGFAATVLVIVARFNMWRYERMRNSRRVVQTATVLPWQRPESIHAQEQSRSVR